MPIYHFVCPNNHEFEKLVRIPGETRKWCDHCQRITGVIAVEDPTSEYFKQKVCSECLGNQYVLPALSPTGPKVEVLVQETCPECQQIAVQQVKFQARKSNTGTPDIRDSSIRFHFNYPEPSDN